MIKVEGIIINEEQIFYIEPLDKLPDGTSQSRITFNGGVLIVPASIRTIQNRLGYSKED